MVADTSRAEAMNAFEDLSGQIARLVTDIRLGPGPDGWEVARHGRKHDTSLPIVYVTANAAGEWTTHGLKNSLLVQKPYAPAELLAAISTLISEADSKRVT